MSRHWIDASAHRPRPARRHSGGGPDRCVVCGWRLHWNGPLDPRGDWTHDYTIRDRELSTS